MHASRPSLLVYATGGTIGMRATERGLAPDPDFAAVLERLVSSTCERLGADYRINHQTPPIDSANAGADTAPRIAAAVRARVRTLRPRGVVVLHGTDTLAYTAARLAFDLRDLGAPVVLTGSQLPHGAAGGDAEANLGHAMRVALRAAPDAPVSIAFGGELLPAVRSTKHHTDALDAFRAERPLAAGAEGVSAIGTGSAERADGAPRAAARVISFRFVPGTIAEDLRASVGGAPDGLVLECYGSGDAPTAKPGMADALRDVCATLPVVAVTQCALGGVDFARYAVGRQLEACGAIDGGDLTVEAGIAKLGYLLDRGVRGAELRDLMRRNLVGERTP